MKLLLGTITWMLPAVMFADQPKAVYSDQAEERGFTIESSELNPGVVQVAVTLPQGTKSVGLIIRGSDGQFISSSTLEIRDNRCSAILSQAVIGNSSLVMPYIAKTEDEMTELYFGKATAEQAGDGQPSTAPESKPEGKEEPKPESKECPQ